MDSHKESSASPTSFARATAAAASLRAALPPRLQKPRVAIICGSGLGGLQHALIDDDAHDKVVVSYEDVPGMPRLSVEGHEGKMVFAFVKSRDGSPSVPVVLFVGRAHFYEGHSMDLVTFATRICRCLDTGIMIVTNAAGGLNPTYRVGDLVLLSDHLNLAGLAGFHPLRGPNDNDFGTRFPPLSDAYDLDLRRRTHDAWAGLDTSGLKDVKGSKTLHEGIYAFVSGPSYETRAECRMLRLLGADVVGMSTVPEVIVARHAGMRVLALSLVTNCAVLEEGPRGDDGRLKGLSVAELEEELGRGKANHEEVLVAGREAAVLMQGVITSVIGQLGQGGA